MRTATIAASLFGCTILLGSTAHAQAARHYDCSKPGNANKTVCKNAAAPAAAPAAATMPAAEPAKAERHYDCSKAGNANKAICKGANAPSSAASAAAAPAAAQPAKPSLLDRLRGHRTASPAAAPAGAMPAAPSAGSSGAYKGKSITTDPAGATGQCKDGTYTHVTHHSGACSSHGGVAKWMNG